MRSALVTGAASGIGAAVVDTLCRQGYAVGALDACLASDPPPGVRYPLASREQLDEVVARHPEQAVAIEADVRDLDALRDAADDLVARFGRLDATVAAAAVVSGGTPVWETSDEELRAQLEINTLGVWNTATATIPHMLSGPEPSGCRFVAIASAAGERGLFRLGGYTMSKHAVVGIVRGLAADLVGTGVTAVAVLPGSTSTAMLEATAAIYGVPVSELTSRQALRRALDPSEIAATVALCCSVEGAALNGSVTNADGGFGGRDSPMASVPISPRG